MLEILFVRWEPQVVWLRVTYAGMREKSIGGHCRAEFAQSTALFNKVFGNIALPFLFGY